MAEVFLEIKGLPEVKERFEKLQRSFFARSVMTEIGNYILFSIKKRTSEGFDYKGQPFTPYSPGYKLFRDKTGHPSEGVNLTYTGSMLASMTYKPEASEVTVYFMNTKDSKGVENPKKAFFNNEEREFFKLSSSEIRKITDIIEDYFRRVING